MLWVGGNIFLHGLDVLGFSWPYDTVHHIAEGATQTLTQWRGAAEWALVATMDGIFGLALGLLLIPVGTKLVAPVWQRLSKLNPVV